jgi:type VI secretion system protein ImpM
MSAAALRAGQAPHTLHFGKLPSRGDFVRSAGNPALVHRLDAWLSQTVALMSEDPRWKLVYDAAAPVDFAVLGPGHPMGLAGHLIPSRDAAGRRFPFVRAAAFAVPAPAETLPCCPMGLVPFWHHHAGQVAGLAQAQRFAEEGLTAFPEPLPGSSAQALRSAYEAGSGVHTLAQMDLWAGAAEPAWDTRQALLALGMLLQPVRTRGHAGLSQGLLVPLPEDPAPLAMAMAMSLWTSLIVPFFQASTAEIFFAVCRHRGRPVLLVGFRGASPVSLRAALDPEFALQQHHRLTDSAWVEAWVESDFGLRKLSTVLRDPSLSWRAATDVFHEVFLGV